MYSCTRGLFWRKCSLSDCTVLYFSDRKWFRRHFEVTAYKSASKRNLQVHFIWMPNSLKFQSWYIQHRACVCPSLWFMAYAEGAMLWQFSSDQSVTPVFHGSPNSYLWAQKVLIADIHQQLTCISVTYCSCMTMSKCTWHIMLSMWCRKLVRKQQTVPIQSKFDSQWLSPVSHLEAALVRTLFHPSHRCHISYYYVDDATATYDLDKLITCCCEKYPHHQKDYVSDTFTEIASFLY